MAWTNPRTWSDTEFVNAALLNTHLRDNLLASGPHLILRKTSDTARTSTSATDDTSVQAAVAANEVWLFRWLIRNAGSSDMKVGFSFPTGGQVEGYGALHNGTAVTAMFWQGTTSPIGTTTIFTPNTTIGAMNPIDMWYINGANAGNVTLQWASQSGASVTLKTHSCVYGVKLA